MINSRGKHTRTYTRTTHSQSLCSSVLCVPLSKCPHFPFFYLFFFQKKDNIFVQKSTRETISQYLLILYAPQTKSGLCRV